MIVKYEEVDSKPYLMLYTSLSLKNSIVLLVNVNFDTAKVVGRPICNKTHFLIILTLSTRI